MKNFTGRMRIVMILAICFAMAVPAVAFAGQTIHMKDMKFTMGKYSEKFVLSKTPLRVDFAVENGEKSGENRISSVKIDVLDEKGKTVAVPISPNQFNQNVSFARGYIDQDVLAKLGNLSLDIKVGGPKDGMIKLTVIEFYNGWNRPSGW